ncbi:hypothetical protein [Sediminitomix flava]|uniref:Uncharacterized protein n=1 Tax=Sediminitomix flava TaxID=379075 RepID=A0A315Z7Y3_SEDFL|nr:hypothetical protein [Sediminitomix flava]PWJ41041.1 hypothetical protein BC781_104316 [Sediminitomix flava]
MQKQRYIVGVKAEADLQISLWSVAANKVELITEEVLAFPNYLSRSLAISQDLEAKEKETLSDNFSNFLSNRIQSFLIRNKTDIEVVSILSSNSEMLHFSLIANELRSPVVYSPNPSILSLDEFLKFMLSILVGEDAKDLIVVEPSQKEQRNFDKGQPPRGFQGLMGCGG